MSSPLREVAAGPHARSHGNKQKIPLPGDNHLQIDFNENIASALTETRAPLYRRDTVIVTPNEERRRLDTMKAQTFISWSERYFITYKMRIDANGEPHDVLRSMSKDIATNALDSIDFRIAMPEIKRTRPIPMPLINSSGEMILTTPGYHPESNSYTFPCNTPVTDPLPIKHKDLPSSQGFYDDTMSLEAAVIYLYKLYAEFPFADWSEGFTPDYFNTNEKIKTSRSFACQIGAALAMFAGGCIPHEASRMGFLYNANSQRSGKTLLAKMVISTIFGTFKTQSWRPNDEEMQKLLDSETLAASNYICFDNIRGLLASQPLEGFMTTPTWTGRILGKSEMFEAENNASIFVTGNNLNIGTDVMQRFLTIDLNIEEANVQDRKVKRVIDDVWLSDPNNRHQTLSALWALVRYWNKAGRPQATGKPYLGFEQWGNTLGGIVEYCGIGNILERPSLVNAGDTESSDMSELVGHLSQDFNQAEYTFQQVIDTMYDHELVAWKLKGRQEYSAESNRENLRLDHAAQSAVGLLLRNYSNGAKGKVYKITSEGKPTRPIRFSTRGKGRLKRYVVEDLTPKS
jgi:hypothetical protein